MAITVKFRDNDKPVTFNESDRYAIEGGALVVDRGDGTRTVYSPALWETIEDPTPETSGDPAYRRLPK